MTIILQFRKLEPGNILGETRKEDKDVACFQSALHLVSKSYLFRSTLGMVTINSASGRQPTSNINPSDKLLKHQYIHLWKSYAKWLSSSGRFYKAWNKFISPHMIIIKFFYYYTKAIRSLICGKRFENEDVRKSSAGRQTWTSYCCHAIPSLVHPIIIFKLNNFQAVQNLSIKFVRQFRKYLTIATVCPILWREAMQCRLSRRSCCILISWLRKGCYTISLLKRTAD